MAFDSCHVCIQSEWSALAGTNSTWHYTKREANKSKGVICGLLMCFVGFVLQFTVRLCWNNMGLLLGGLMSIMQNRFSGKL